MYFNMTLYLKVIVYYTYTCFNDWENSERFMCLILLYLGKNEMFIYLPFKSANYFA